MSNIIPSIKYLFLTLKHKWYVFIEGMFRVKGIPVWILLMHDLGKFSRKELPHYGRQFLGKGDQPEKFIECWVHHQNSNKHHWEYWVPRSGHNGSEKKFADNTPIPMPEKYVREMVADWLGAGRAYNHKKVDVNNWIWFDINVKNIKVHKDTRALIMSIVEEIRKREGK